MLGWSKSKNTGKPAKIKAPKPPKAQVVITMPRKNKEFGMGTFGTETGDVAIPAVETTEQLNQEGDTSTRKENAQSTNTFLQHYGDTDSTQKVKTEEQLNCDQQQQGLNSSNPENLSLNALQQHNSSDTRQDQSLTPLRTPGTPATLGSTGIMTPHSARTSYFPATPASDNTFSTNSTNTSNHTTSTTAFGNGQDHGQQGEIVSSGPNNNEQQNQQPTATTPCTPVVPETKRQRHNRSEIPPAIVTNPSLTAQRLHHRSTSQTPSTPHTPVIFANKGNYHSLAAAAVAPEEGGASGSYPTPASLTTAASMATPKTSNSMSEWRMMQMQLQQQDDLHFSLTLPSVSALTLSIPSARMMSPPSAFGYMHVSGSTAASVSASSSTCSCCCYSNTNPSPSATGTMTGTTLVQSPISVTPTFGNMTPGPDSATQHHSFLLHPSTPASALATTALTASGSSSNKCQSWVGSAVYQHHPNHSIHNQHQNCHKSYSHGNFSTSSSDYFSCRELHAQGMANGHGLGPVQGPLVGSTATLLSEYTPSSVDPCESEHPTNSNNNGSHCYGPSSAGSEIPLNQLGNYPYLRSAPASAVGGGITKHCKNCPQNVSRRPSMATGAMAAGLQTPVSLIPGSATVGGADMEFSASGASSTGLTHSNSLHRSPSPSQGPFRSFSSKLAVNTIRKLSISQKSLFSNSKEDLLADSTGFQCCQENTSRENVSESGSAGHNGAAGCNCYRHHGSRGNTINGSGSVCSEGDHSPGGNKVQRVQSKLSSLRGATGSKRGRKDKNRKSSSKSYETEYNFSSQFVRQEFAQYNYERQIEDFQRAARVFKEQKTLTTAAEARAAVAEASAAAAATATSAAADADENQQTQQSMEKSTASSSSSFVNVSVQDAENYSKLTWPEQWHNSDSHDGDSSDLKGRKKSIAASTRSGILRSVSRSHRRVGASAFGSNASAKVAATALTSSKRSYGSNLGGSHGSRGSSVHNNGGTDSTYLELGQVGMGMGSDLKLPGLGLGGGFRFDAMDFDPHTGEATIDGNDNNKSNNNNNTRVIRDASSLDANAAIVTQNKQGTGNGVFDDIPLDYMITSSSSSMQLPRKPDDIHSLNGRPSNASQDARAVAATLKHSNAASNVRTGRSVHSVCSVDTVSQQIAARHRLAAVSNVASLHSQSQAAMNSNCESIGAGNNGGGGNAGAGVVLENSPIQVIRATVGTIDDPSLPCFTFRMWVLSTIFVVMGAAISEYNFFRSNSAYFSIYFVQLASYFCGKAMAKCLPTREFEIRFPGLGWAVSCWSNAAPDGVDESEVGVNSDNSTLSGNGRRVGSHSAAGPIRGTDRSGRSRSNIANTAAKSTGFSGGHGKRWFSWKFTLNPGKFNMKEHMLIGVAAAAGCSPAYATNVIAIQSLVFNSPLSNMTGIGLVISSQFVGFSMAWLLFDYVIKPSVMIWPATLVNVSLYNTLHEHKVLTKWFTRMQLFWYAFFAIFIYQWLPRMFMPVLTSMALLCWIKPSSNVLRKLGSGYTGLGMGCISLDWSIISGVGPLYTPWWAQCNFFVGLIGMLWVITPIVYFSDYWSAKSYPIVSSNIYDNSSQLYDVAKIVNKDLSFNATMYDTYSPVIMTPYFAITYGTSFMAVIATLVHVVLFYGSDIWFIARSRCIRKVARMKNSPFYKSFAKGFQSPSNLPVKEEEEHVTSMSDATNMNAGASLGEYGYNAGPSGRRDSGAMSSKNDMVDGGAGMGSTGGATVINSDEHSSFQQSAHYQQLSQPHDSILAQLPQAAIANQPGTTKPIIDDRGQIPTEMFGTEDIHTSLMRAYPEIPGWWFGAMFVICFAIAVCVCTTSDIRLPVHALILALLLAVVFALPMAIIQALSSSQIGLNVLSEVVCGYLLPGNQLGNSVFKCYSYMALYQCLNLTQGFKLGHYMKVPPRKIFIAVIYGTLVGAFINLQVLEWVLLYNRKALFDADPHSGWSFRNLDLFFSASLLWGAISPTRLFAEGSIYQFLPYCFILGIILPVPFYVMYRYYPPYGAMCKGDSPFPFLPKCKCPASHIAASSEGDATAATVFPKARRSDLYDINQSDEPNDTLEAGRSRSSGAFGHYWPFSKSGKRLNSMAGSSTLSSSTRDANSSGAQIEPEPSVSAPHVFYGNPDSVWDHRLRRFPWHLINTPLICVGASFVPQAPASFVVSAGIVAFCFAFLVLRYHHEWWRRYTFVLAAALDAGTQICNMAIFVVFSLILKGSIEFPSWFGNDATNPEKCGVGDGYN
ncbi:hypothetical protein BGX27_010516 [Mortierella sp. AM989]|nr:hypothetical protein BGX27_010516 [Mortierella sp. AM989]